MLITVVCPNCSEQGKLQDRFLQSRIKCKKCGKTFTPADGLSETGKPPTSVNVPASKSAPAPRKPGDIEVEGLEDSAWTIHHDPQSETIDTPPPLEQTFIGDQTVTEVPASSSAGKAYKVLTTKDPYFKGKFELPLLEAALNHYASRGWVVRSMAHPMIQGFSGVPKEELIILLER